MHADAPSPADTPAFRAREFAPGWGAAVMGTGVLSVIFRALAADGILAPATSVLALVFFWLVVVIAIPILGTTAWRWVRYPSIAWAELAHPVKGGMAATFPGGMLVLAVVFGRTGQDAIGPALATPIALVLTGIGGVLALALGVVYLSGIFARGDVAPPLITGALFIPPVVTIIIPTALAPFLVGDTPLHRELLWLSWALLGIGAVLYVVIVAALFARSTTAPLPPAMLAPSLFIGMGPAGLLGLNTELLAEAGARLGVTDAALVSVAQAAGLMMWGFGLWWGITAVVVVRRGYPKIPFALSWWGYTFPLGAWVVSGLVLGSAVESVLVRTAALVGAAVLLVVWTVVAARTLVEIRSGRIWAA